MTKSIKLTGRITESKSSKSDIEFVLKKLDQGMDQATLAREAIKCYRKYEDGTLFTDEFEDRMTKIFQSPELKIKKVELLDENYSHLDKKINEKLKSGDWGI